MSVTRLALSSHNVGSERFVARTLQALVEGACAATTAGVKSVLVSGLVVDTFNNVNLSGVGPVGTSTPPELS